MRKIMQIAMGDSWSDYRTHKILHVMVTGDYSQAELQDNFKKNAKRFAEGKSYQNDGLSIFSGEHLDNEDFKLFEKMGMVLGGKEKLKDDAEYDSIPHDALFLDTEEYGIIDSFHETDENDEDLYLWDAKFLYSSSSLSKVPNPPSAYLQGMVIAMMTVMAYGLDNVEFELISIPQFMPHETFGQEFFNN